MARVLLALLLLLLLHVPFGRLSTADLERTSHFASEMTQTASEPAKPHRFKDIGARTSNCVPGLSSSLGSTGSVRCFLTIRLSYTELQNTEAHTHTTPRGCGRVPVLYYR
jgi:hypothetical protein